MAYLGSWKINDYLPIPVTTHRFSSGAAYQPTSLTYSIYEDSGTTGIDEDVDMTPASPFDAITGLYYARRQLTAAAGFEKGKNYLVVIKATVDSVSAVATHTFQIEAEVDANIVSDKTGYALTQSFPTNFADLAITASTGKVTVGTNDDKTGYTASTVSDKTGYSLAADQSGVTVGTVTTLTNHTPQTGDSYAVVTNGTYGLSAIEGLVDDIESRLGTPSDLGSGATVAANLVDIEGQTDDIGAAGVGLTALAQASVCTEARLAELDGGGLPADVAAVKTDTGNIAAKLPSKSYLTGTANTDGDVQMDEATGNFPGSVASVAGAVASVSGNVGGNVTGSVGSIATGGITTGSFAAGAIDATAIATGAVDADALAADAVDEIAADILVTPAQKIVTDASGYVTANLNGDLTATMKTSVNDQVVDVVRTDTVTEITAVPAANATLHTMIQWLFSLARNKRTTTATTETLRNDADGADIGTAAVSDDATTFTRGEWS